MGSNLKALLILAFVCQAMVLTGQTGDKEVLVMQARQLTTHQGLSNNEVTGIIQDYTGYIWIGTQNGLNRFNGYDFDIFRMEMGSETSLTGNNITALFTDNTDSLWIGNEGLSLFRPAKGNFRNWRHEPGDTMNLSDSHVNAIAEDDDGRIWIASYYGVGIMDRNTGRLSYLNRKEEVIINPATIELLFRLNAPVRAISRGAALMDSSFPDEQALLEALSDGNTEDPYSQYYDMIISDANRNWDENSLKSDHVVSLVKGGGNSVWIVYRQESLSRIDAGTMEIVHYDNIVGPAGIAIDQINHVAEEGNNLWIATSTEGLKMMDITTGSVRNIDLDGETYIQHLRLEGRELWISDNSGVIVYETDTGRFRRIGFLIPDQGIMTGFIAKYTFRDNQDNLWVGTHYTGVLMTVAKENFRMVRNAVKPPTGNPENAVATISFDKEGNLWVGYVKGEIEVFSPDLRRVFTISRPETPATSATDVFTIYQETGGKVWTGSFSGGIEIYDNNGVIERVFRSDKKTTHFLPGNDIRDIRGDSSGNIFIAVHGYGMLIYNKDGAVKMVRHDPAVNNSLISDWINTLCYDPDGYVWIGTVDGLSKYSIAEGTITNFDLEGNPRSLVVIRHIFKDSRGYLWLGTDFGVMLFDPSGEKYFRFTTGSGLTNNIAAAIVEDSNGNIWISTRTGINRLHTAGLQSNLVDYFSQATDEQIQSLVQAYGLADGLLSDVFSYKAGCRSESGHIFFGGAAGVVWFHPDSITVNSSVPPVIISRLNLFNREVRIGDDSGILENNITHSDKIVLKYSQRVISFEYHALNYIYPEKNTYAYIMEGFDADWTMAADRREATYTNLNPGTYRFRVRAANNSGIWNEEGTSIEIIVRPPLWRTNAAYFTYALLIILLSYLLRQIMMIRTNARLEVTKAREIDEIKTSFFTDVSHEFRTPLTLIEGPVEKLMREKESFNWNKDFYQVNLVYRNVQRLKLLITELMEFRRLTHGRRELKIKQGDLAALVNDIKTAFDYLADEKKIDFSIELSHQSLITGFDPGVIEKVLFNLLSNAFKFTPAGGCIVLRMQLKSQSNIIISEFYARDYIRLEVSDSGPGIPENVKEKVFERFYKTENGEGNPEGSGIGLALVKELVSLHKGEVVIDPGKGDKQEPGTSFIVKIPFGDDYYPGNITGETFEGADTGELHKKAAALAAAKQFPGESTTHTPTNKRTILIVEDDTEVRQYLINELQDQYRVRESDNAKRAADIALSEIPDLILSDIIMPGTDGIEFCRMIKSDLRTEHIPVILLTARSEEKDRIEGLETGADDFIIKPFIVEELKLRIKNCINTRVQLRNKFLKELTSAPANVNTYSADDRFLSRALKIVNDNISSPDLDVDFFASEIGMSRAQLYRKFNALTNQTVKEFVRTVRLRKAAEMLETGKYQVSEVAYAVGFSDLPYFTRSFKSQFGVNPSKYTKRDT
jgi:signal transduction histidine kinase/ligand-binding sensor domain-containing protein/DNA-binding response OmpR family regulator